MSLQADSNGVVQGAFTIPERVPTGTKSVLFTGSGGSRGEATFTGEHFLDITTMRNREVTLYGDPLAQTFTPSRQMLCGGVDIWVCDVGTSTVEVQIRETNVGLPTKTIVASARLDPAEITANAYNRFAWAPVQLQQSVEYAFVVLCDDAVSSVGVAKLGKWDSVTSQWITAQPYSVGVLLSSSNASTWTPHQDEDLTFKLLEAAFTSSTREVDLGTVPLDGATDVLVMAPINALAAGTSVVFQLTMPGGDVYTVSEGQPIALADPETGDMGIVARLAGNANASPVLMPGVQVFSGVTQQTGTYITRVMPAGNPTDITVTFEAITPGDSGVVVECQPSDGGETWTPVPLEEGVQVGDGWEELTHKLEGYTDTDVRVRLTLAGSAVNRPRVRQLRAVVT